MRIPVSRIEAALRTIAALLVQKDYSGVEALTGGVRLKEPEIARAIAEYGRTLVSPPSEAFGVLDVVPIRASKPPAFSVRFRLYTLEEGESDLELQLTLIEESGREGMRVELDDIIVP
ncbi:DUF7668 domain-containing protein [Sandaracinus amylolyticus]|uniref:DUF7668 domain-containing protein n=1 Tax=Sandaracinus amylolyticus TaxID=927083 RepID=UPI001F368A33|nr:hypothetical protein [Sandaracinus amylolyticus]UJR86106.1 Hypothetical protein I5071_81870 [Sandaracinus amylolyticus]